MLVIIIAYLDFFGEVWYNNGVISNWAGDKRFFKILVIGEVYHENQRKSFYVR